MDEIEEPVNCPSCGEIVELQDTKKCKGCQELFCTDCLRAGFCGNCEDEQGKVSDAPDE